MKGHAQGKLPVVPQLEYRLVVGGIHADAATIDDAGDAKSVHFAKEPLGALDLLLERRLRQLVENPAERVAVGIDDAGWLAVAAKLDLAARRDVGIAMNAQRFHRLGREQQPIIEMLDVDGILRSRFGHI